MVSVLPRLVRALCVPRRLADLPRRRGASRGRSVAFERDLPQPRQGRAGAALRDEDRAGAQHDRVHVQAGQPLPRRLQGVLVHRDGVQADPRRRLRGLPQGLFALVIHRYRRDRRRSAAVHLQGGAHPIRHCHLPLRRRLPAVPARAVRLAPERPAARAAVDGVPPPRRGPRARARDEARHRQEARRAGQERPHAVHLGGGLLLARRRRAAVAPPQVLRQGLRRLGGAQGVLRRRRRGAQVRGAARGVARRRLGARGGRLRRRGRGAVRPVRASDQPAQRGAA
mmetsp:Transcript_25313/g.59034  ORF Transcript_25313/g.59034 Transcript_25313/m.59034 type:complete len:283 (+) Transcript_25313:109-957(+)